MFVSISLPLPHRIAAPLLVWLMLLLSFPEQGYSRESKRDLPGVQAILTGKGMKYLTDIWVPIVKNELIRIELSNYSGDASISEFPGVKVHYTVGNIKVGRLNFGQSSISSEPEAGLIIYLDKSYISASADWQFNIGTSYKLLKIIFLGFSDGFSDKGSLAASAEGVQLKVGINVSADEQGHPRITMTGCCFELDNLNVTVMGDTSPFYNGLIGYFEDHLKELFNKTICKELKSVLKRLDKDLAAHPVVVSMGDDTSGLDLALTKQPDFTKQSIVTNHKGGFVSTSQPNLVPHISPASLPPPPSSWTGPHGKMAYVRVTEYMAQTAVQVYTRAGKLRFNFSADSIDSSGPFLRLDTTTFSLIIPQLFHRFGAQNLMITVRARDIPPTITFTEQGADIAVLAALDVYVVCNNSATANSRSRDPIDSVCEHDMPLALTLGVSANVSARIWLGKSSGNNGSLSIMGNAYNLRVKLNIISTNVGDFDVEKINKFAVGLKLIDTKALPIINDWVNKGFAIPDLGVQGLTLENPELTFQKGYVTLGTDISYHI